LEKFENYDVSSKVLLSFANFIAHVVETNFALPLTSTAPLGNKLSVLRRRCNSLIHLFQRKTRKPVIRQPSIRNVGDEQHKQTRE
jgi:hypothetical protein